MPKAWRLVLMTTLLLFLQNTDYAASDSSTDDWDPFLATDIPTASDDSYNTIYIPMSSDDLDDYMSTMSTVSLSSSVYTSTDTTVMMTATAAVVVTTSGTLVITPSTTTTTTPLNTTTLPVTNSTNCVSGSGVCFMEAQGLGDKGTSLHGGKELTVLLLVVLVMLHL